MGEKKDPGKFTVRFNAADPQQRTVIEILNQQGRYKAQFLTNAILHYIHCSQTPKIQSTVTDSAEIERIVRHVLAQQQTTPALQLEVKQAAQIPASPSEDEDRDAIFKTLEAFQQK